MSSGSPDGKNQPGRSFFLPQRDFAFSFYINIFEKKFDFRQCNLKEVGKIQRKVSIVINMNKKKPLSAKNQQWHKMKFEDRLHWDVLYKLDHVQFDVHEQGVMLADFLKAWSGHKAFGKTLDSLCGESVGLHGAQSFSDVVAD